MKTLTKGVSTLIFILAVLIPIFLLSSCDTFVGDDGKKGKDGEDAAAEPEPITSGNFTADILPLFTQNEVFFDGAQACTECHFNGTTDSLHELNMGSYAGILLGPDATTGGEDLLGRGSDCTDLTKVTGVCAPDWDESAIRHRLRDTRMPPGWPFDLGEGNRGTLEIRTIEAWVTDGAQATGCGGTDVCYDTELSTLAFASGSTSDVDVGGPDPVIYRLDEVAVPAPTVADLFKMENAFFTGSQACTECHGSLGFAWHELDLGSYAGILLGPDGGEDMLGRGADCTDLASVTGVCAPVWGESALRRRLRNTRMPPDWSFELSGANRDMWAIQSIQAWVEAGAPKGDF